jgi:hypothetical protein
MCYVPEPLRSDSDWLFKEGACKGAKPASQSYAHERID